MQIYAQNMHKICHDIDFSTANMQKLCKNYAHMAQRAPGLDACCCEDACCSACGGLSAATDPAAIAGCHASEA